jgi:NRAMP (natural resistance-associated macrophage protein)-like metal ion transporter
VSREITERRLRRRGQHHHRRQRLHGHGYFSRLGPGLVTGAADDDPSGIGTYSQVGARFGYTLLWSTLAVAPLAAAVQELAARLGLATGRGLARLIGARFGRVVLLLAVLMTVIANTFNIAADVGAMAASTKLVLGIPPELAVVAFTAAMLVLAIVLGYAQYARVLRWLALSLLAYPIVLMTVNVDWAAVVHGLLVPDLSGGRAALAALLAVFGTTVSPYLFFWQTAEELEETHAHRHPHAPLGKEHLVAMRVDVIGGMVSAVGIAFAIMVVAASTLHVNGITTVSTAQQAAGALRPVAGDAAELVFTLGIVGLGLLAVPVLAGSTAYALAEAFGWHEGLSQRLRSARGFYAVLALTMLAGLIVDLVALDPIRALYYAAILNGIVAPPLIVLMIILGRDAEIVGRQRSGALSMILTGAAAAVGIALPVIYLVSA